MRRNGQASTWKHTRFLQGFDVTVEGDLVLPRGMRHQAAEMLNKKPAVFCNTTTNANKAPNWIVTSNGQLSDTAIRSRDAMLTEKTACYMHLPGRGKTVMACAMIAERAVTR